MRHPAQGWLAQAGRFVKASRIRSPSWLGARPHLTLSRQHVLHDHAEPLFGLLLGVEWWAGNGDLDRPPIP